MRRESAGTIYHQTASRGRERLTNLVAECKAAAHVVPFNKENTVPTLRPLAQNAVSSSRPITSHAHHSGYVFSCSSVALELIFVTADWRFISLSSCFSSPSLRAFLTAFIQFIYSRL